MLPEKKVIGNQGAEFIEERMRGLASFMRNIVANPYLRNDHTLIVFLTLMDTGAGEWEQAKKVMCWCGRRRAVVAPRLLTLRCMRLCAGCCCW